MGQFTTFRLKFKTVASLRHGAAKGGRGNGEVNRRFPPCSFRCFYMYAIQRPAAMAAIQINPDTSVCIFATESSFESEPRA